MASVVQQGLPLLLLACLVVMATGRLETQTCDTSRRTAIIQPEAEAMLVGLINMHNAGPGGVGCSDPSSNMQAYESIRWILELINKKDQDLRGQRLTDYYVPGIRIGMMVYDYCDSKYVAVNSLGEAYPQLFTEAAACLPNSTMLLGVVGPSGSEEAMEVAKYAGKFDIPVVSFSATASSLTQSGLYPNFLRTVSPDGPLMDAIVQTLLRLDWKYVAVVYTDNTYGRSAYEELRPRLVAGGVCLTVAVVTSPTDTSATAMDSVYSQLLGTGVTGVIYLGNSPVAYSLLERGEGSAERGGLQWIFTDSISLVKNWGTATYQNGILVVLSTSRAMVEFEDYWVRINESAPSGENPWFQEWFTTENRCSLPGYSNPQYPALCRPTAELQKRNFIQDRFAEPAVHAVFTYARALRNAQTALCGGQPGMCPRLRSMSSTDFLNNYVKNVDFVYGLAERVSSLASKIYEPYRAFAQVKFDSYGDITIPAYDVWSYNDVPTTNSTGFRFQRAGYFVNNRLTLTTDNMRMYQPLRRTRLDRLPTSPCPQAGCTPCLGLPPTSKYWYRHGDIVLSGVFTLHDAGITPLTCGGVGSDLRRQQMFEAMVYALDKVPSLLGAGFGASLLGGLAFDDCGSSVLSKDFITRVQQGRLQIKDATGNVLDPRRIDAYTAASNSPLTIPLAEVMNVLQRPLLGYASRSSALSDRGRFPYYLRVHPSMEQELRAIILLLQRFNWLYVQVVHADTEEYTLAAQEFKRMAAAEGICVVATHSIMATSGGAMTVDKLHIKSNVKSVVVLGEKEHARQLLTGITERSAFRTLHLIGSSGWGDSQDVTRGNELAAEGAITLKWQMSPLQQFRTYLSRLAPATHSSPWFQEWFQAQLNCSLDNNNLRGYPRLCSNVTFSSVTTAPGFMLNHDAINVINAVYAVARGLQSMLRQQCGGATSVCAAYLSLPNRGAVLLDHIRNVSFTVEDTANTFSFSGYEGNLPFEVYNFLLNYTNAGTVAPQTRTLALRNVYLTRELTLPTSYRPSCPSVCVSCLYMMRELKHWYIPGDLVIPAVFDLHYSSGSPFSCGIVKTSNGLQYVEAFNFALDLVNRGRAGFQLNNVTLGGLAVDGCSSSRRATTLVNMLQSGALVLQDSAGQDIRSLDFLSWLGYDSQSTIDMADILASMGVPIVTPGATVPLLLNKERFSTFFRTIASDSILAEAMAKFLRQKNKNYVLTLNAPEAGGRGALASFKDAARANGICILASYEFATDGTIQQIVDAIVASTTEVVVVFAEPDRFIQDLVQDLRARYPGEKVVFVANREWDAITSYADKSFMFTVSVPSVIEAFRSYLQSRIPQLVDQDPWLREYYQARMSCNLPGQTGSYPSCSNPPAPLTSRSNWRQDLFVLSTINAVVAIAKGLQLTLNDKCGNTPGVCSNFRYGADTYQKVMQNMDTATFVDLANETFYFVRREANSKFLIKQFESQASRTIGDYTNETVTLVDDAIDIDAESKCDEQCLVCQDSSSNFQDFSYIPGNIYLVGLFDVHNAGATPYTCGEINTKHGLPLLEAFNYALEYVNNRSGIFQNILDSVLPLGGIALDVCKSPTRAANLVANIHAGNINLRVGSRTIQPNNFDVYVGTLTTDSSLTVADVLDSLSIPQISYGATSLELRDSRRFRYFLRTVPADDKQARALISYLKRFDVDNVQVISSFESVGESGKEEFLRLAYLNRICVTQNITVGMNGPVTTNEANLVMAKLLNNTRGRVVVLFLDNPRPILQAAEGNAAVHQHFFFLGTDKWGADPDYLQGLSEVLVGRQGEQRAATLDVETADLPGFDTYLASKTPSNYIRNPWFREYYERVFDCTMNDVPGRTRCGNVLKGISRAPGYIQDPYVLYVVNAVFSAALGIDKAIRQLCGSNTNCNIFRTSGERRQLIWQGIKQTNFTDATQQPFYFTAGGESDRGYHIYEPIRNPQTQGFVYKNVGSYNDTHYLKLDIRYELPIVSNCVNASCPCNFPVYQPSRYMAIPSPNDLNLIYFGDIHKRHSSGNPFLCGAIDTQRDFQNMLAFFYAIELVNRNEGNRFPSSLRLGGVAVDTCSQPLGIGRDLYSLLSGETICRAHRSGQVVPPSTLVAVIADRSSNAIPVSSILSPVRVTSLSQSATSVALSDKLRHAYFLRTVPPDNIQAVVMLEVMQRFGWRYASLVYSDDAYGIAARTTLLQQAAGQASQVCVGRAIRMDLGATLTDAERIMEQLGQQAGGRVVILFTLPDQSRLLLQAAKNKGLARRFVWLASDTWGSSMAIVQGYEEEASGAVTIQIRSEVVDDFTQWMTSLTLENRKGIPDDWFEEFYQRIHRCRLLTSDVRQIFPTICSGQERITAAMVPQDPFVLHTIISVYIVARGLDNIPECASSDHGPAACLSLLANRRELIYQGIKSAQMDVLPNRIRGNFSFSFTSDGYGDVGYNILNFHRSQAQDAYVYRRIGIYQNALTLDRSLYRGITPLDVTVVPLSQCPVGTLCRCLNADGVTTRAYNGSFAMAASAQASQTELTMGADGLFYYAASGRKAEVETTPDVGSRFSDIWGVIVAAIAAMGVLTALALFLYLLVIYPNRGGTSILGYMLAFGIILLYGLVFAFIFHANEQICAIRRFCLGFCYAICYAALFVKLIDCWRVMGKAGGIKYNKLGTPLGLFFLAVMLVLVQVLINAEWLILVPPTVYYELYNGVAWPRCSPLGFYDEALVLSLVYIMVLIVLCVIFGFCTFSSDKNNYESRWILGVAILTIPCFVIWCLVSIIAAVKVRDAAVAVGLVINATMLLMCGPVRKLYLLNQYQNQEEILEDEDSIVGNGKAGTDYNSMYGRHYDNAGRLHDRGSMHGGVQGSGSAHGSVRGDGAGSRGMVISTGGSSGGMHTHSASGGMMMSSGGSSSGGMHMHSASGGMMMSSGGSSSGGMHMRSESGGMMMSSGGMHSESGGMMMSSSGGSSGGMHMHSESHGMHSGGFMTSTSGGGGSGMMMSSESGGMHSASGGGMMITSSGGSGGMMHSDMRSDLSDSDLGLYSGIDVGDHGGVRVIPAESGGGAVGGANAGGMHVEMHREMHSEMHSEMHREVHSGPEGDVVISGGDGGGGGGHSYSYSYETSGGFETREGGTVNY